MLYILYIYYISYIFYIYIYIIYIHGWPEPHWWVLGRTKHVSVDKYALNLFIEHSGEHWWEQNIFCSFTAPQVFWQSSALGALSTLVTSAVLYSLTRDTLMSPGKGETRVCGYIYVYIYIYIYIYIYNVYILHMHITYIYIYIYYICI